MTEETAPLVMFCAPVVILMSPLAAVERDRLKYCDSVTPREPVTELSVMLTESAEGVLDGGAVDDAAEVEENVDENIDGVDENSVDPAVSLAKEAVDEEVNEADVELREASVDDTTSLIIVADVDV
jgi:hypothetical protein